MSNTKTDVWGGRISGPVNFGTIKIATEKAVGAVCDEFGKGTQEGCGIDGWSVGTTVCEH